MSTLSNIDLLIDRNGFAIYSLINKNYRLQGLSFRDEFSWKILCQRILQMQVHDSSVMCVHLR